MKLQMHAKFMGIIAIIATASMIGIAAPASASESTVAVSNSATVTASANEAPTAPTPAQIEANQAQIEAGNSVLSNPWITTPDPQNLVQKREPTGNYVYNCVLSTGNSYTMAKGSQTNSCDGVRLIQYLNGVVQWSIAISGHPPTVPVQQVTIGCLLAGASLAYGVFAVITTAGGAVVVSGLVATAGLAFCTV